VSDEKFYPTSALEQAFRRLDTAEAKGDDKEIAKARQRIRDLDPHGTGHLSMMPLTAYEIAAKDQA